MADRCPECGFEYYEDEASAAGSAIVVGCHRMAEALESLAGRAAGRHEPDTWSPLEYACHVRDVLLVQRERVILARWTDTPSLAPMGRDQRVEFDGYSTQDPGDVARQLRDAALLFANVLSRLDDEAWARTLTYNFPDSRERSLRWVAVHTRHEIVHHRGDIERQLATGR
jgi:hypothetical protein